MLLSNLEHFIVQKLVTVSPLVRSDDLNLIPGFCDVEREARERLLHGKRTLVACCPDVQLLFKDLLALLPFLDLQVILTLALDASA